MTMTETGVGARVPAWVDLDAICPVAVRERISALTAVFDAYVFEMREEVTEADALLRQAEELVRVAEEQLPCAEDVDLLPALMALIGASGLYEAMDRLGTWVAPGDRNPVMPWDAAREVSTDVDSEGGEVD